MMLNKFPYRPNPFTSNIDARDAAGKNTGFEALGTRTWSNLPADRLTSVITGEKMRKIENKIIAFSVRI